MKNKHLLDSYIQQAVIQTAAGTKYKVIHSNEVREPSFDGKKIILPVLGMNCTEEDLLQQRAFVHRCAAYGRWGEGFRTPILKDKNPNPKLTQIFHQTDDTRCEKLDAEDYAGVYTDLVSGETSALNELFKQLVTLHSSVFDDDKASRELAQLAAHTLANSAWNPASRDCLDKMVKLYKGTKTGEYVRQIADSNVLERCVSATEASDSYKAAKEIYDILYKDCEGEGEGTGDHGKSGGKSCGDLGAQSEGETGKYGEGVGEDDKVVLERILTEYKDFDYEPGGRPNPVVITYENRSKTATASPVESLNSLRIFDFKTKCWPGIPNNVKNLARNASDDIEKASAAFANRVRTLLQIKAQAYYTHGHKKGTLSSKRIYRVAMDDVGDGSWNRRVYKKRHQDRILDLAVAVMIDVSGSMHCTKTWWTYKGCVLLNDVFHRILHVPTEIACFNTDDVTNIGIIKPYTAPIAQADIKRRFDAICGHMTGNNDSTALLWSASRLALRREERKVLIMLSDGQPSAGGFMSADYMLRSAVQTVEARRDMELYSIGIEYNGVKDFYKNWSEVKTGLDIEEALLKVLGKALKVV